MEEPRCRIPGSTGKGRAMCLTDEELIDIPPERMAAAYMEYRRSGYEFIRRSAVECGVLDALREPATVAEFAARHQVVPGKLAVAELLLGALNRCGAVYRVGPRFAAVADHAPRPVDDELIRLATGKSSYRELGYSGSFGRVVASLTQGEKPALSGFDASNVELWDQGMQLPYYRYGRLQAVRALVSEGNALLDLASGSGLGLLELARYAGHGKDADLVGVEISPDFLSAAAKRTSSDPRIRMVAGDLERPLELDGENCFDGAMLVGAYHYLRDPVPLWQSLASLLRAGGVVCLAMTFSRTGSYDQELVDLRYAQRSPAAVPRTPAAVAAAAATAGFRLERDFWFGCFGWLAFRKDHREPAVRPDGRTSRPNSR
ncbi:class I SAM-dependent methyltransferase [Amycolatopsis lurida]